ncbi:TetR/AcrR family transcriptional regulator [Gordonia westfalica]|uniref:TetR/AcrR family transcriptional regulator n=1 Tax=Gordonia westfalica TaxID=158898 RepID=A0ABU2GQ25_9ACTN|nr:TetR/AcrR family transcriptional regulator [Gordonia westfalica]MDS1113172.1 TetR/AcrR family transcriptional regulator [Gordonia westfalica]
MIRVARPRVHTDDVREKLLDEAVRIVEDGGLGALSVRDVAHAAGTSTSAVYSLLGSKEGLARGVLLRAFASFESAQTTATIDGTDPDGDTADLTGLGIAYVGWALEHPRLYELMFGEARSGIEPTEETKAAAARAIGPLREGVSRAIEAGVFRDAEVDTVAASLWAQVHGSALLLLAGHYPAGADPVAATYAVIDGWRAVDR